MKPYLLFDFDGTIANSLEPLYQMLNRLAPQYGYATVNREQFDLLRNWPWRKALKQVKLPLHKMVRAIPIVLAEYRKIILELDPCPGVPEMLESLSGLGIPMALLSSNDTENVQAFLEHHHLHYFEWAEGTGGILKKHSKIARQIRRHKLNRKEVIYIGDESRDIIAARRCGIKVICVGWGFHTVEHLCSYDPDYLVKEPEDIVGIMRSLIVSNT